MLTHTKLKELVAQNIITQQQYEQITAMEKGGTTSWVWKSMLVIAALFIGLGFILLIGANWDTIPSAVKLFGDFIIFGAILYGAYWSNVNGKRHIEELFLALSFLFTGDTIGLIAQIFHLSGGWNSFALSWAILTLPIILLSKSRFMNAFWLIIFMSAINFDFLKKFIIIFESYPPLSLIIMGTVLFGVLAYVVGLVYEAFKEKIVLPLVIYECFICAMYIVAVCIGAAFGISSNYRFGNSLQPFFSNIFVFAFLGVRLFMAFIDKNIFSLRNNVIILECFIIFLFISRYGNLFTTGLGFIFAGILLLAAMYCLRKTNSYFKTLEL